MSVVVPFPGLRAAARGGERTRGSSVHPVRGGTVISWVRPATCECCGRPTLAGRTGLAQTTLCGHCSPPNVA